VRRAGILIAVAALLAAACAAQDSLTLPDCSGEGPVLIMAQSVPTASQIPCLNGLPEGWSFAHGDISESGSAFIFDSDRAGDDAAVLSFGDSCDVGDAIRFEHSWPDIEGYDRNIAVDPSFRAERSYVFDGGCVRWSFDFDQDVSGTLTVEIDDRLQFVSRVDYEAILDETFMDVDL